MLAEIPRHPLQRAVSRPVIETLARHRRLAARVAHAYQREWGELFPERSWADTFDALLAHGDGEAAGARTWVALDGERPLGAVTRVETGIDRIGLHGPWLAGPWVRAEEWGRGLGGALVGHAERESAAAGVRTLHALAFEGAAWLLARGWRGVGAVQLRGRAGEILVREL